MPDRQPDLMQRKVETKKVIDLSKLNVKKLTGLFKIFKGKDDRKAIWGNIHFRHTTHQEMLHKANHRQKRRRRNEMAKESRRRNRT